MDEQGKPRLPDATIGTFYVLVFVDPYTGKLQRVAGRAARYSGFSARYEQRLQYHRQGQGSKLTRAAVERGFKLQVALLVPNVSRHFERWIKNRKDLAQVLTRTPEQLLATYNALGGDAYMKQRLQGRYAA